jgi:hypothetical protein
MYITLIFGDRRFNCILRELLFGGVHSSFDVAFFFTMCVFVIHLDVDFFFTMFVFVIHLSLLSFFRFFDVFVFVLGSMDLFSTMEKVHGRH